VRRLALGAAALLLGLAFAVLGDGARSSGPKARHYNNIVAAENAQPGNSDWQVTVPTTYVSQVEGYADQASYKPGDTINLYLSSNTGVAGTAVTDAHASLNFYRLGWYGGAGARLMLSVPSGSVTLYHQGFASVAHINSLDNTNMVDCANSNGALTSPTWGVSGAWPITYSVVVPSTWVTGYYLVRITGATTGKQSLIVFVIRDDSAKHKVLVQNAAFTWAAYNGWGGASYYTGTGGLIAHRVSLNRPYAYGEAGWTADATMGSGQLMKQQMSTTYPTQPCGSLCNGGIPPWIIGHSYSSVGYEVAHGPRLYTVSTAGTSGSSGPTCTSGTCTDGSVTWTYAGANTTHAQPNDAYELNTARWLEANGYDVQYVSDPDIQTSAAQYTGHQAIVLPGHHEYWTWEMRDALDAAINAGVSVASFSANTSYWQIRAESAWNSTTHSSVTSNRVLTGYKYCATHVGGWTANTTYSVDSKIVGNGANNYIVIQTGISAPSGSGPTGTGSSITDGTVIWAYLDPDSACSTTNYPDPLLADTGATSTQKQHTTYLYNSSTVNRSEAATFGLIFGDNSFDADLVVTNPTSNSYSHWLWSGLGVVDGTALAGVAGNEMDTFVPISTGSSTVPSGSPLKNATAQTQLTYSHNADQNSTFLASASQIYTAASGGYVWTVGSYEWAWGLDSFTVDSKVSRVNPIVQGATANFLSHVGASP
jgi:hypothetical protein